MPLGEDVPMLIPISIVLTIFLLFIISLFVTFIERGEVVQMSEAALSTGDYVTNMVFAGDLGMLDRNKIDTIGTLHNCEDIEDLNITINYQIKINISKTNTTDWWCWDNTNYYSSKPDAVIKKTVPIIIQENDETTSGKVDIIVGK